MNESERNTAYDVWQARVAMDHSQAHAQQQAKKSITFEEGK